MVGELITRIAFLFLIMLFYRGGTSTRDLGIDDDMDFGIVRQLRFDLLPYSPSSPSNLQSISMQFPSPSDLAKST